jgi:MarR family transcriptional regulator, lower aerobic nicotinate degradation pathway regulator
LAFHALAPRDTVARSDAVTRAIDAFRRIFRALHLSARRAERELGLSGAQLFVLQQLDERAAHSLNDLAERTHTHQSSVSVVVRRLVDRGLVSRSRSPHDTRRVELRLTAPGRALLRRSRPATQSQLIQAIAELSSARRRDLAGMLERLVRTMGLAASPAVMMFTGSTEEEQEEESRTGARGRGAGRTSPRTRGPR